MSQILVIVITGCVQLPTGEPVNKVLKVVTGDETWKSAWYYNIGNYISQDATYTFSLRIYHEEQNPVGFKLTLKTTPGSYRTIIQVEAATPATWITLESEPYLVEEEPSDIYVEPMTPGITFYFDDFVIKNESGEVVLKTNFESGETEGWQGNNATITVVSDPAQD